MHVENSFVIDDWYPVGALVETVSGRKYHTRILGTAIWYQLTDDGVSAGLADQTAELASKSIYGLLWVSLSDKPRDVGLRYRSTRRRTAE